MHGTLGSIHAHKVDFSQKSNASCDDLHRRVLRGILCTGQDQANEQEKNHISFISLVTRDQLESLVRDWVSLHTHKRKLCVQAGSPLEFWILLLLHPAGRNQNLSIKVDQGQYCKNAPSPRVNLNQFPQIMTSEHSLGSGGVGIRQRSSVPSYV